MVSAFKTLFTDAILAGGDPAKFDKNLQKQLLKVFVKETQPYFLVSDSFFYVPAYFTKAALDEFGKKFPSVKVQDLTEKVIMITNWSLELKRVDSNAVFTSYGGIEVRLIVNSFKPQLNETLHPTRWPTNLYRDDEFKTTIQQMRHNSVRAAVAKLPTPDVPLFSKGDVSQGVVSSKGDDWQIREGNTAVVAMSGGRRADAGVSGAAKVKAGASAKRVAKAAAKGAKTTKTASNVVGKVAAYNPAAKKPVGKKSATAAGKTTVTGGKASAVGTVDEMTMSKFKKYLSHQKKNTKSGKKIAKK